MTRIQELISNETEVSLQSGKFDRKIRRVVITGLNVPVEGLFILKVARIRKDTARGFEYQAKAHNEIFTDWNKLENSITLQEAK